MADLALKTADPVFWARRLNGTWLVRGGLDGDAAAYMDHLAARDPARLRESCLRARKLVEGLGPAEDPKPWFYGGLFSLATAAEAGRFAARHPFVSSVIPSLGKRSPPPRLRDAGEGTRKKIGRIKKAIAGFSRGRARV